MVFLVVVVVYCEIYLFVIHRNYILIVIINTHTYTQQDYALTNTINLILIYTLYL